MWAFSKSSFGTKLVLLIALTSAVAVLLVCVVLAGVTYINTRHGAVRQLLSQAEMLAYHSTASLDFDDPERANQFLAALSHVPEIAEAVLERPDRQAFARFQRESDPPPDFPVHDAGNSFRGRWLVDVRPVLRPTDAQELGTLRIVYDLSSIQRRLWVNVVLAIGVGAAATLMAVLLALRLRTVVARPVSELASAAARVSATQDYSVRATRYTEDELGRLTDTFNDMLAQIQSRDAGLKAAHEALAQSHEELQRRNREMQQFVYTVSHDLRSPLVTIRGFTDMLSEDMAAGKTHEAREFINRIVSGTDKMNRLIDDLLELSRIGRMHNEPEDVDPSAMVGEIADAQSKALAECGGSIRVQVDMPRLVIDRVRLWQVFENLVINAIKYGCEGPDRSIEVGGSRENGQLKFFVRDHGPGIPPEHHERIFGLFQRLHSDKRGTGVGLAIVAKIMQVYGGRCWVESEVGKGATFRFTIPGDNNAPGGGTGGLGQAGGGGRRADLGAD